MEYLKIEQWSFTSDSMEDWKKNDKHRWDITVNGIINDSKCEKNLSFLIKKKKKRLWTASVTHTTQIIKLILK